VRVIGVSKKEHRWPRWQWVQIHFDILASGRNGLGNHESRIVASRSSTSCITAADVLALRKRVRKSWSLITRLSRAKIRRCSWSLVEQIKKKISVSRPPLPNGMPLGEIPRAMTASAKIAGIGRRG